MTAKRNRIRFGKFFRLRLRLRPREAGKSGRRFFIFSAMLPRLSPGTHGAAAGRASESFPAVFSWRAGGCGAAGNVFRGRAVSGRKIRAPPKVIKTGGRKPERPVRRG